MEKNPLLENIFNELKSENNLTAEQVTEFGRDCVKLGKYIQKNDDYDSYGEIATPIINECWQSDDSSKRTIGAKLLNGFKKFK
jgi:hypothetical protein